jgi:hypothetical protein
MSVVSSLIDQQMLKAEPDPGRHSLVTGRVDRPAINENSPTGLRWGCLLCGVAPHRTGDTLESIGSRRLGASRMVGAEVDAPPQGLYPGRGPSIWVPLGTSAPGLACIRASACIVSRLP